MTAQYQSGAVKYTKNRLSPERNALAMLSSEIKWGLENAVWDDTVKKSTGPRISNPRKKAAIIIKKAKNNFEFLSKRMDINIISAK